MNIDIFRLGPHQRGSPAEMAEQRNRSASSRREQLGAGPGGEGARIFATELGADGNVLRLGLTRRPAGGPWRGMKRWYVPRVRVGRKGQRVDVVLISAWTGAGIRAPAAAFVLLARKSSTSTAVETGICFSALAVCGNPRSVNRTAPELFAN